MELNTEQIKEVLLLEKEPSFIKDEKSLVIRQNHDLEHEIIEVYADTATSCGDLRKEVFGVCKTCEEQLYHFQNIRALEILYPVEYVGE